MIRSILIACLRAASREILIYQEKSLMAADHLTGCGIKRDLDGYRRLEDAARQMLKMQRTKKSSVVLRVWARRVC